MDNLVRAKRQKLQPQKKKGIGESPGTANEEKKHAGEARVQAARNCRQSSAENRDDYFSSLLRLMGRRSLSGISAPLPNQALMNGKLLFAFFFVP